MTSEQKEAFLNSWFGASDGVDWTHGMAGSFVDIINAQFDEAISAYTRATPSADPLAGMVRYDFEGAEHIGDFATFRAPDWSQAPNGKYVLHSEAARIIAAEQQKTKDAEGLAFRMDRFAQKYLRHLNNEKQVSEQKSKDWFEFCEAIGVDIDSHDAVAEKINSMKSDVYHPDLYVSPSSLHVFNMHWPKIEVISVSKQKTEKHSHPLYAAPVSGSLKAENERLRGYAQSIISAFDPDNDLKTLEQFNAWSDLRAALNVEASNDKG